MIRLSIFKEAAIRIPRRDIEKLFANMMKEEAESNAPGKINLIFTTDKNIRRLNRRFRKKNKPTDVLSFNIGLPSGSNATLGEIYISINTAQLQAGEYGSTLNLELLRLFCHGLLHLLGYDHINLGDRAKMEAREKYFLKDYMVS